MNGFKDTGRNHKASLWGSLVSYTANKPQVTRTSLYSLHSHIPWKTLYQYSRFTFLFPSQNTDRIGQVVSKAEGQGWLLTTRPRACESCGQWNSVNPGRQWQQQCQWACGSSSSFLSLVHGSVGGWRWVSRASSSDSSTFYCPLITASPTSPGLDHCKIWVRVVNGSKKLTN